MAKKNRKARGFTASVGHPYVRPELYAAAEEFVYSEEASFAHLLLLLMREHRERVKEYLIGCRIKREAEPTIREWLRGSPLAKAREIDVAELSPHDLVVCWHDKIIEKPKHWKPWHDERLETAMVVNVEFCFALFAIVQNRPWRAAEAALGLGFAISSEETKEGTARLRAAHNGLLTGRGKGIDKKREQRQWVCKEYAKVLKVDPGDTKGARLEVQKRFAQEFKRETIEVSTIMRYLRDHKKAHQGNGKS